MSSNKRKHLSDKEKEEMQMKFIKRYQVVFDLLEKCHMINHTQLEFFTGLSERTSRRFANEYLERRVVKINDKITILDKEDDRYKSAGKADEIYKELIEKLPRGQNTLLKLKNRAFNLLGSTNREISASSTKLDNANLRAIEYKLRKESDLKETENIKKYLLGGVRLTRDKKFSKGILDKNNNVINKDRAYYDLMYSNLVMKGYNPQVFLNKFIINKIKIENNSTALIYVNYVFKDTTPKQIPSHIDTLLASFELLKDLNYRKFKTNNIDLKFILQIYSTTCLNVAAIEKAILNEYRVFNNNYYSIEHQVFPDRSEITTKRSNLDVYYERLFNKTNKYFIYDEQDKRFKIYY